MPGSKCCFEGEEQSRIYAFYFLSQFFHHFLTEVTKKFIFGYDSVTVGII